MKSLGLLFFLLSTLIGVTSCRVQHSPPELIKLSASKAYVDQSLTLTGYQFGSEPTVMFGVGAGALSAPMGSHDETTIQVTVPRVAPGNTQVRVQTQEGTSDPLPFTVLQPAPIITTITPANGLQGQSITVTGDYLNQLQRVRFNDIDAVVQDSSAKKITFLIPATVPRGPQALAIATIGGEVVNRFIVAGTPQITSVSPVNTKPGAELVIQGKNFTDGIVSINGLTTDKTLTTIKDTEIRTIIPATATSGRVTVQVFETLVATSTDTVKIFQPPFITHLLAQDGIAGDKLVIEGRNMSQITSVSIGNAPATFRILSDTQIEAVVPALPASAQVSVSASGIGGNTTATDPFFFYLGPSNLVLNPARQLRGKTLTISGKNLYRITAVSISGIPVPITSRNEGIDLLVGVPTTAVSGSVTVTSRAGTASAPLVIVQKAIVSDVIPLTARPGERVVLRGDYLKDAQIFFTGSAAAAVDGGKNEDTERWVTVPADAQTGPLRVTNLTNETTTTAAFTVLRLISGVDFTPKSGKVGDDIILTGQNIATVQEIRFGNGASTAAKFAIEGATIRVTIPTGATTGQICLTNAAGTTCTSASFTVTK
ncbi:IPT/TIG domain-containing protein [Spirosoma radiotolerans]|uniref:Cell shape determination protein CcmA n=1 Tax=Spirosoma radiotolerans TaxID=1379870 RepID=A0A0E4A0X0_9BACT|nr:IPT/TIG domain-containing protein [Spirosoma radiotolerans]AKD58340.1 cell shape determination protein CcmA [Spirosoma radiotolerans]